MLLIVEKEIRRGMYHVIHWYAKVDTKYMKNFDKNNESLYLKYWDANNLYGETMSQKLPINLNVSNTLLNVMKIWLKKV